MLSMMLYSASKRVSILIFKWYSPNKSFNACVLSYGFLLCDRPKYVYIKIYHEVIDASPFCSFILVISQRCVPIVLYIFMQTYHDIRLAVPVFFLISYFQFVLIRPEELVLAKDICRFTCK